MSQRIVPEAAKSLRKAQDLIRPTENWCQHSSVAKIKGKFRYCAIGAVAITMGAIVREGREDDPCYLYLANHHQSPEFILMCNLLHGAAQELYSRDMYIQHVNDNYGHEAVMKVFDYAINKLIVEANSK
jgi:hypothetical protein